MKFVKLFGEVHAGDVGVHADVERAAAADKGAGPGEPIGRVDGAGFAEGNRQCKLAKPSELLAGMSVLITASPWRVMGPLPKPPLVLAVVPPPVRGPAGNGEARRVAGIGNRQRAAIDLGDDAAGDKQSRKW